jgi:hypothetical protein
MRYALAFVCGALVAIFIMPPQPSVEVDDMTRREIAYEVIEILEQEDFDTIASKRAIILENQKKSWFSR